MTSSQDCRLLREKLVAEEIRLRGKDGIDYLIRPIRPSDTQPLKRSYDALSERSKWFRMLHALPHLTEEIARELCSPDPDIDVCLVLEGQGALCGEIIGGARVVGIGPGHAAEFAVTLRDEVRGLGLAQQSLEMLIDIAREADCASVWGHIAASNTNMLRLARRLGFEIRRDPDDLTLSLAEISLAPE
jgi:acetyltransferase